VWVRVCIHEHKGVDDKVLDNDQGQNFWLHVRFGTAATLLGVPDLAFYLRYMLVLRTGVHINNARQLITDLLELAIHEASLDAETSAVV
jgi:hypothetical protein